MLRFYVARLINDTEEATDIVQNIFVRLMSYDIISSDTIKGLCFKIANNLVIDYIRRNNKRQRNVGIANYLAYSISTSHTAMMWQMLPIRTKKWKTECM